MIRTTRALICALLFTWTLAAHAEQPKFSDFPIKTEKKKAARIKYSSELARQNKSLIQKNVGKSPNFSGHYNIVEYSCGSGCVQILLVNRRNGKVTDPKLQGFSEFGYTGDSKLLIATHVCTMNACPKTYFLYRHGKWKPLN